MRRRSACEVCGYRLRDLVVAAAFAQLPYRQPRWPHRVRILARCPECGWLLSLITRLWRGNLEGA